MNYKKRLYLNYATTHTCYLYGGVCIKEIEKQFPIWKKYFGRFLPENKEAKILEVGCGNGGFIYYLQTLGFKNTEGIDISKEQVELAHKLGIENVTQIDVKEFLSRKSEILNVIFARDFIEHFTKDEILEVLTLILSALKQGGALIIQTPNAESPFGNRYIHGDFTHDIALTANSLNQILRSTGFNNIECYPTSPVPHGVKSLIRFLLWKLIESTLKFYMLVETGSAEGIYTQNILVVARK